MIVIDDDDTTFQVKVRGKGDVIIDGPRFIYALSESESAKNAQPGKDAFFSSQEIAAAAKSVGESQVDLATDEWYGVGQRVLDRLNTLGNSPGPRPISQPPMASRAEPRALAGANSS